MDLYLIRHGNTFTPGEKVVWVGRQQDLPLTQEGLAQAEAVARELQTAKVKPAVVFAAPLKRTRATAEIIARAVGLDRVVVDARLSEIDYGLWGGLTNEEIISRFGKETLAGWNHSGVWPPDRIWGSRRSEVQRDIQAFAKETAARYGSQEAVAAVSSGGCMRFFLSLVEGEFERRAEAGKLKVRTGSICRLKFDGGRFGLDYWDKRPGEVEGQTDD